jgi:hypothetical protein
MNKRDELVFMLGIAQEIGLHRDKEMLIYLFELMRMDIELTPRECTLLRDGYKQIYDRFISYYYFDPIKIKQPQKLDLIEKYQQSILTEYKSVVLELIQVTDNHLLPACTNEPATIPILLNKAIMQHHMAKIHQEYMLQAQTTYETALQLAKKYYQPIDRIRIDVVYNLSMFYWARMNAVGMAYSLAHPELTKAVEDFDSINDQEAVKLLQQMRDNLRAMRDTLNETDATKPFH